MQRVIAYIDGFNLYFGIRSKGWSRYYWLNPRLLIENLLKPGQQLVLTKYFTARVSHSPDKHKRQTTFHLWWARRPLAAARAVIFTQMVDDPSANPDLFPTEKSRRSNARKSHPTPD